MARFNTGNPVGSKDPRDLSDNAQNIDEWSNGSGASFSDRLGVQRRTIAGMTDEFQSFLDGSAYDFLGDYAADIEVTSRNQVIREDGEFWRVAASTELPYTTTGAGMPEGGAFAAVGDAVLRQDLAGTDGLDFIGGTGTAAARDVGTSPTQVPDNDAINSRGFAESVASVADLRALTVGPTLERIWLEGYYGQDTPGGGALYVDRADTTSADNGGTVFVTADGLRVKRSFIARDESAYGYEADLDETSRLTLFCDPNNGSDLNRGTDINAPLATVQEAVDRVPKGLKFSVDIDLYSAVAGNVFYDEDILASGIDTVRKPGTEFTTIRLRITGEGASAAGHVVTVGSICLSDCHGISHPWVLDVGVERVSPYFEGNAGIFSLACTESVIQRPFFGSGLMASYEGARRVYGVVCFTGHLSLKSPNFNNTERGVHAKRNAFIGVLSPTGSPQLQSYDADELGIISLLNDQTTPGSSRKSVTNGGIVFEQNNKAATTPGILLNRGLFVGNPLNGVGLDAVAIGEEADVEFQGGIAIGVQPKVTANFGIAIGSEAEAGSDCTAVGRIAKATGSRSVAVGRVTTASHSNSVALGEGATTTQNDQVMIGGRDLEITSSGKGVVLASPNGTRYRLRVADDGTLTTTAL